MNVISVVESGDMLDEEKKTGGVDGVTATAAIERHAITQLIYDLFSISFIRCSPKTD